MTYIGQLESRISVSDFLRSLKVHCSYLVPDHLPYIAPTRPGCLPSAVDRRDVNPNKFGILSEKLREIWRFFS